MQINPGGLLNIEDVIGRDAEIARYVGPSYCPTS